VATKIILRADIANLGKRGDICDVADGYARNYLLPKGLALRATEGAMAQAGSMRRARDVRDAQERSEAEAIASQLVPKTIVVRARVGSEGRLFGSVTAADLVEAVEAQTGIVLDRRKLLLHEPLKHVGTHSVSVKLHAGVEFPVTVEVTPGG
jgi:large subunit ribosomal protein L9